MEHSEDLAAAAWLTGADWQRLVTFGPATFPAYARLRYVPDPVRPGMDEADVQLPPDHRSDIDTARAAVRALVRYSSSADSLYACLWEGAGTPLRRPELARGPLVVLPHRRYLLFTGGLEELDRWEDLFEHASNQAPAFIWPTDHRWCFASDVDPHWAGIGADRSTIDRLVADEGLDAVLADPAEDQPTYS